MEAKKYFTIKEMAKYYPFLTEAALRHHIRDNTRNIKKAMIKVGGRLFFDVDRFNEWLESQRLEKESE